MNRYTFVNEIDYATLKKLTIQDCLLGKCFIPQV